MIWQNPFVLLVLLAGCPSSSLPTVTPLRIESKHRVHQTAQRCGSADVLRPILERAWPAVAGVLREAGVEIDEEELGEMGIRACLLEQPDVCGAKPGCTAEPICARRRGCSDAWARMMWVARLWPPVCREEWLTEPYCVDSAERQSEEGLENIVVVELHALLRGLYGRRVSHAPGSPDLPEIRKCLQRYDLKGNAR